MCVSGRSHREPIFVVRGLKNNLLGLPALTALWLVQKLDATHSSPTNIRKEFPKVFTGLGKFSELYDIQLKELKTQNHEHCLLREILQFPLGIRSRKNLVVCKC